MSIIEITPDVYDVDIGLTYATNQNFTGKPIYASSHCYLHQDAAKKLEKAIELVKQFDLRIRIFDCLRPTEAQWMLWRHTPDPDFLAHPANGSPHSRGVAIDLSLSDKSGKLLNMGTTFDEFTNLSHHGAINISLEAQRNRFFLKQKNEKTPGPDNGDAPPPGRPSLVRKNTGHHEETLREVAEGGGAASNHTHPLNATAADEPVTLVTRCRACRSVLITTDQGGEVYGWLLNKIARGPIVIASGVWRSLP